MVETDASDYAIGACIMQIGKDGKLHPVAFYSKKIFSAEMNYDIHDKELLAVVTAFQEWRVYLKRAKYQVKMFTDYQNLTYFLTTKKLNRRQVRWAELILSYNFKIYYHKGSENGRVDALSRRADHREGYKVKPYSIFRLNENGTMEYNYKQVAASLTVSDEKAENAFRKVYQKDMIA